MTAATKMRCNRTSSDTPSLLAHSRRNAQSLGAMSLGVSSTVAKGVSTLRVSARDSIIRHGRFLLLNRLGVGCVGLASVSALASPLFWWVRPL